MNTVVLTNGSQTVTFVQQEQGYRPEWFREGSRPMLRFTDHEWLRISLVRVTHGQLLERSDQAATFGGTELLAGEQIKWTVRVALPEDGREGFTVTASFQPTSEPVEVIEALCTFELPYEYDGSEHNMTLLAQQAVYYKEGDKKIAGAGYEHPFWYYSQMRTAAHLTYPCSSPLSLNHIKYPDGSNERWTMVLGNWDKCSTKDMFIAATRKQQPDEQATFADPKLQVRPGLHGMKFLIGAINWNASLVKDPNVVIEPGVGLSQEVIVDYASAPRGGTMDAYFAHGWERLAEIHMPRNGRVGAYEVHKALGASWIGAADWLQEQFASPVGCHGFYYPKDGTCVYAPFTRPRWDYGSKFFAAQFAGPLAYLHHMYKDEAYLRTANHLEQLAAEDTYHGHGPDAIWTIGPTPMYVSMVYKANLVGISEAGFAYVDRYVKGHTQRLLDPSPSVPKVDAGALAFDAYMNLIAADKFGKEICEKAARELLERVNKGLEGNFWSYNCSIVGDAVGHGGARPFGHGVAMTANALAWKRFGDDRYLHAAKRFANLLLAFHFITWNESPTPDLDTRGWCQGSTGGRDQWAQIPPWETGLAIQQFASLLTEGQGRQGIYDAMWLFSRTGLAAYPKARCMKRLYKPDMSIVYRPIYSLPTEREYYLKLPYLAYENPWDQTMLAGYQGVEGLILSLMFGGGLVAATDDRVMALVPQAAMYRSDADKRLVVELWNPTSETVETRLHATVAQRRNATMRYSGGSASGEVSKDQPLTAPIAVPTRQVVKVVFTVGQ